MKTIQHNGVNTDVSYKTSTDVYTRFSHPNTGRASSYGADIYTISGSDDIALCGKSGNNRSDLKGVSCVISAERYSSIAELHNPYDSMPFHNAIMSELGFH